MIPIWTFVKIQSLQKYYDYGCISMFNVLILIISDHFSFSENLVKCFCKVHHRRRGGFSDKNILGRERRHPNV